MPATKRPRKAYRRKPVRNPIQCAILAATKLTDKEIAEIIGPSRQCLLAAINHGLTERGFRDLQAALHAGITIEDDGVVTGLRAEFEAGIEALDMMHDVCFDGKAWHDTQFTHAQCESVEFALDMHEFQIQQLSAAEFHRVIKRLVNQVTNVINTQKKAAKA